MCSFCPKAPQSYLENDHDATFALSREFKRNRESAEAKFLLLHSILSFHHSTPTNGPRKPSFRAPCVFLEVVKCSIG
jgi:hypothetical protein